MGERDRGERGDLRDGEDKEE